MGNVILDRAVEKLNEAGIRAQRGYGAGAAIHPEDAVAAVNLAGADMRNRTVTALVQILSPAALGCANCEEKALAAGEILRQCGGKCSIDGCSFDGKTGLFCQKITAQFASEIPKILVGEVPYEHVLAFTSWRTLDEEVTDWSSAKWQFRLEEYIPMGEEESEEPLGSFTLVHVCENGTESYIGCTWTYQRRVWDATGVRQIRLGIADYFEIG